MVVENLQLYYLLLLYSITDDDISQVTGTVNGPESLFLEIFACYENQCVLCNQSIFSQSVRATRKFVIERVSKVHTGCVL